MSRAQLIRTWTAKKTRPIASKRKTRMAHKMTSPDVMRKSAPTERSPSIYPNKTRRSLPS